MSLTRSLIEIMGTLVMLRLSSISGAALAGVCAVTMFATSVAAEDHTTDIGTLDKETADKDAYRFAKGEEVIASSGR